MTFTLRRERPITVPASLTAARTAISRAAALALGGLLLSGLAAKAQDPTSPYGQKAPARFEPQKYGLDVKPLPARPAAKAPEPSLIRRAVLHQPAPVDQRGPEYDTASPQIQL